MFAIFVLLILAALTALAVLLIKQARKERERVKKPVVDLVLNLIEQRNLGMNDLRQFARKAGLSSKEVKDVALRVYCTCYRCALDNPVVWEELPQISAKLRLSDEDRNNAELPIRLQKYLQTWSTIAGDVLPSSNALETFLTYQGKLGITARDAASAFGSRSVDLYRGAYRLWLEGSPVVDANYLKNLRTALGMDEPTTFQAIKRDVLDYVAAECESILATDNPTIADRDRLLELMRPLNVDKSELPDGWQRLERLLLLKSFRDGALPKLNVQIALRAGEICHYRELCDFSYKTSRGEWHAVTGDLFLSNQRLILASVDSGKSFEMKLSSIVDFELIVDAVQIRCTAKRGTGKYQVRDYERLESLLAGVLRNDHSPALRSRNIPSFIKQQVWARDNGKCVLCGSIEELHFDHDLPFSKGGSNTVENIRLLCARCNLQKHDRIE